jgi:hypothetical protein
MDEDENTMPSHLFIGSRHEFQATRVVDNRLSPTTIKVKVDFSTLDQDSEDYTDKMDVALEKMSYFTEKVLKNCIIISAENEWAVNSFLGDGAPQTSNMVMLCPEDPTDALLGEILLCKFKALCAGAFQFHAVDIESTDGRGLHFTLVTGNPGDSFDDDVDWLTERNYFSRPWWHRDDASTLDMIPDAEDDIDVRPSWAYSLGFIADRIAASNGDTGEHKIVRPEFRPKIKGGKED